MNCKLNNYTKDQFTLANFYQAAITIFQPIIIINKDYLYNMCHRIDATIYYSKTPCVR